MTRIMAKQKLILFLTIIFCISVMVSGCKGVDMSTPRSTVKGYIEALENYDYNKMAKYLGQEAASFPRGPDLEFRNIIVGVISQTETEATVYAQWEIWVEVEGMKLPAEDIVHFEFELIKVGDEWIIQDLNQVSTSSDLENTDIIKAHHIAEAIQYRPRSLV
ncbi:hypothetical protein ES703_15330 [subsurface metagenome]